MSRDRSVIKLSGKLFGDEHDTVCRTYIVVHEPGMVPEKKIPEQSNDGVSAFLIELEACRPEGTHYTVVQLIWDGDIWVHSGHAWLGEHRICAPRKFAQLKRDVLAALERRKAA